MKIPKSHFSEYFKRSVVFLVKTELAVFIISIIEYIDLLTNMIDNTYQLFFFGKEYDYKQNSLSKIILTISPYQYFFNYITSGPTEGFTRNYLFIIIYTLLSLWYLVYFLSITNCNLDEMSHFKKFIQKLSINFFDFVLYRILPIYCFDVFSREIMKSCSKGMIDYSLVDLIILFFALFILGALLILHIIYYSKISVWTNFRMIESYFTHYPYDSFFSSKCDMIFCLLKCIIALNKNYLFYNKNKVDYISLFLSTLLLLSFIGYVCFIVYLFFFSYQILYFFMTGFNMLRTMLILFMFESIFVRLLLFQNKDYKSFFVYEFIFFLLDTRIIFAGFYNYVISKAIKSQNYLAVCWFIQANKMDITQFITEWIANHKTVCTDKDCEICEELIKGHIKINTTEVDESVKDNGKDKEKEKEKKIVSGQGETSSSGKDAMNVNLISKIYPPYLFNLKLINISFKYKKSLGEEDLIRLDFLYLTVLFLSHRNVEYSLFSKICNLIIKYSENINVSVSLMLIFEIIRKSNLDLIKGYDLIKKNEDLRNSLKEYITEYENFIHFGAKSPNNYLYISNKFREFKQLARSIHTLFKKNLDCNYQLIIMRYAYETLLHIKFKNLVPFDLNLFSDFLEYHFTSDKLFLVKYIIDRDTFTIIKGSKEVLKYQGTSLDSIFPDYLKETGLQLFKTQLENVEKNAQKPLFSFVIKDLLHNESFGFVDSFKMKYFVYPTNMINELLMQATFINGFTNIMIFEELEGEQILFSFSAQLYKYFGLTPNMIYVLKKSGINVDFRAFFPKKAKNSSHHNANREKDKRPDAIYNKNDLNNKNKNNNNLFEENVYLFQYKRYLPLYKKLLECDGLNDVSNYSQLKDKATEIELMSQEEKELAFLIQPKEKFENCGIKYSIFIIKEQKRKKKEFHKLVNKRDTKDLGSIEESEETEQEGTGSGSSEFNLKYEGKGLNVSMPTLSSAASLSRASSARTNMMKNKKDGKVDEKTKRAEEVNRYAILILLFGVFLVGVSIVFLFLEVNENNSFKQLFQLFQTFKIFKRGIESSPLSLLSNYCYYSKTLEKNISDLSESEKKSYRPCSNLYKDYSTKVAKNSEYPMLTDYPIYKIIQEEIKDKYNDIIATFNDYQKAIFNLDSGVINKISQITAFSYSITVDGNIVTLVQTIMNFISLCREFNNYITTLLENDAYMEELFSLVSFMDVKNLTRMKVESEYEDSFTQTRKIMLLMLMAYPSIHIGLSESSTIMQEEFHFSLNTIEVLLIIFFILQIILHGVLIMIFLLFLFVYVKMIKFNILSSNRLFSDRKFLDLQDKRVEQIKIMSNLYQENPNKIADKIDSIEINYKRKIGEANMKKNKKDNDINNNLNPDDNKYEIESVSSIGKSAKDNNGNNKLYKTNLVTNITDSLNQIGSLIEDKNKTSKTNKDNNSKDSSPFKRKNSKNLLSSSHNSNNNSNIEVSSSGDEESTPLTALSQINNVSDRVFNNITTSYKFILFLSMSFYLAYCAIFFVVVLLGCKRLSYLVNYCEVNNEIDGYLFDNFNTLLYMYITNSTSKFYGSVVYNSEQMDYLNDGINDFYAAIQDKETIESEHSDLFPPIYDMINLDCSQGMMSDDYFENATKNLGIDYNEYFKGICQIFPVATTGNDNAMLLEVLYMIDQMYHGFENTDFALMFRQMNNTVLFDCYTLVLTLNRVIRNYFNNYIFIDEVNKQFDYFSTLIIIYLALNMALECIAFIILNFGIIWKIKYNNKLLLDFISSLKF